MCVTAKFACLSTVPPQGWEEVGRSKWIAYLQPNHRADTAVVSAPEFGEVCSSGTKALCSHWGAEETGRRQWEQATAAFAAIP
jgi:hypothetical protein